jgi:hypothetical protein
MSGQQLKINTEQHEVFFDLLKTLDILPHEGEEREEWFKRVRIFEQENEVSIQDMIVTIQEMKRRENIRLRLQQQGLLELDGGDGSNGQIVAMSVKDLFVQGRQVTTQTMQEEDKSLEELMALDAERS